MRRIWIAKPRTRVVTLGAAVAASALLSVQPALAQDLETGGAVAKIQQGDFEISVSVAESNELCAGIRNVLTGEFHGGCVWGANVDVSDTLDSAHGQGTIGWSTSVAPKGRGSKATTTNKSGSLAVDVAWTGSGVAATNSPQMYPGYEDDWCWHSWPYWCLPGYEVDWYQTRAATASGTITDSEWGTFVLNGAPGSMWQQLF